MVARTKISCDVIGCDVIGCDVIGCDVIGCDVIGCDVIGKHHSSLKEKKSIKPNTQIVLGVNNYCILIYF
jgi:hypothetical protein